ncbi:unnamed protein product [Dovyalis caffra]|uniref:CDC48 N-terminal subdomain domain-containing protein n=1 Tax=Dovyalis caffra TaxID=77055 RepID=A0AAV1S4N5_9ROSI|nr:unnamed protein product [Dovyalis caffra]
MKSPEIVDEENRVLAGDSCSSSTISRNVVTNEGNGTSRERDFSAKNRKQKEKKKNVKNNMESDDELPGKNNSSARADTAEKEAREVSKELPSSGPNADKKKGTKKKKGKNNKIEKARVKGIVMGCDQADLIGMNKRKIYFSDSIIERKKAPNRFLVDEAINDDNSVITLNPTTMEQLQIFRGDTLLIKGKNRKDTVFIALADDRCEQNKILTNKVVRSNLRVRHVNKNLI